MQNPLFTKIRRPITYCSGIRRALLLSVVAATFALTGCGQKGPLYLPQPEQPAVPEQN